MTGAPRLLRGVSQLVISELAIKVFNLGFFMLLARRLGAEGMGGWTYAFSFVSVFLYLFHFNLGTLFTREAAARPGHEQALLDRFLPLRVALGLAGLAALVPVAWALRAQAPPGLVMVFGAAVALGMVGDIYRAVFRARQRMAYEAGLNFLERALSSLLGAAALIAGWRLAGTAAAWSVGALVAAVAAVLLARRAGLHRPPSISLSGSGEILRQAVPLLLLGIFGTIYFRQDVLFLRWLRTEREVGLYGAAYRLFEMFVFLPGSLSLAYLPAAAAARGRSASEYRALFRRTLMLAFTLGCPLALGLAFRTGDVVRLLFGGQFGPSVAAARVLVWTLPFYFASTVQRSTLVVGRRQALPAVAVGVAIVINAALNLVLIPRMGILGAAWATLVTEILLVGIQGAFLAREVRLVDQLAPAGRPLLAAGGLAGVLWLARPLPVWWAAVLAVVAYVALGSMLRLWNAEEWRALAPVRPRGRPPETPPEPVP
jgi:O-antigen/teichoic acid export membrane protein